MNKKHTAAGFTLVELIVVIAIVGVLAAILVPSIMGYTKKAKYASANANAKALLNAGMLACRESDVTKPIPDGIYTKEGGSQFDGSAITDTTMNEYITQHFNGTSKFIWALKVVDDVVVGACVADNVNTDFVGTYPHPNEGLNKSLSDYGSFEEPLNFAESGVTS